MPAPTVLVVEDDPTILQLLEVNFEMEGFIVLRAEDGEQGLAVAKECRPDVVVSDVMMPKMSGLELVRALKGSPDTRRSEEHTSELQSLMRSSYAVFCLKKKKKH